MISLKEYIQESWDETIGLIYENGGIYDGQYKLAEFICDSILSHKSTTKSIIIKLTTNDLKDIPNIFFNTLTIICTLVNNQKQVSASFTYDYDNDKSNIYQKYGYDQKTNKLSNIYIEIYAPINIERHTIELKSRIMHELNHAWTYWNILKTDFKTVENVPVKYDNKLHKWNKDIYSHIVKNMDKPTVKEAERVCKYLLYILTRFERNAFMIEILTYLENLRKDDFKNKEKVQQILNNSSQYKLYIEETPMIIHKIKKEWDDNKKKIFATTYNDIYNENLSFHKIVRIIEYKLKQTISKLNSNIMKVCMNIHNQSEIKENTFYDPQTISFFENQYKIDEF